MRSDGELAEDRDFSSPPTRHRRRRLYGGGKREICVDRSAQREPEKHPYSTCPYVVVSSGESLFHPTRVCFSFVLPRNALRLLAARPGSLFIRPDSEPLTVHCCAYLQRRWAEIPRHKHVDKFSPQSFPARSVSHRSGATPKYRRLCHGVDSFLPGKKRYD